MRILAKLFDGDTELFAVGHDADFEGRTVVRLDAIFNRFGAEIEHLSTDLVYKAEDALDAAFMGEVSYHGEKDVG